MILTFFCSGDCSANGCPSLFGLDAGSTGKFTSEHLTDLVDIFFWRDVERHKRGSISSKIRN